MVTVANGAISVGFPTRVGVNRSVPFSPSDPLRLPHAGGGEPFVPFQTGGPYWASPRGWG